MKNNKDLVYKVPLFATLTAVLIAIPLRVYQYFKLINPETGFYDDTDFSVFVMYAALTIAMLVCIVYAYLKHKSIHPVYNNKSSMPHIVMSIIMAAGVCTDSLSMISDYLELYSANSGNYLNINDYISAQGGPLMLIQAVFGILTAIYFVVSGLSVLNKINAPKLKFLALMPVAWCIFRLLFRFKRTISFVNVSDLLLELFMIVFIMMFFLALAQVNSKIDADSVFWKLYAYGFPAAMFSLVVFLPRFILVLTGSGNQLNPDYLPGFSDFTFALYSIYIGISASKIKTNNN